MSSQNVWELIRNGDIDARNEIWEKHQSAVDYIAMRMAAKLPRHVSVDDLKSAGQFGLLDAIGKYDPDRGYKFETYALTRIRGAILDDLRSQDWVPRSVRQRDRGIESAVQELTQYYSREPTDAEIAGFLEISVGELHKARSNSQSSVLHNISQPVDEDGTITVADSLTSDTGDLSDFLTVVDTGRVLSAMDRLQEKEKLTIALHYFMGYTLAEIGRKFGVTESRVCQIHTKALKIVRQELVA